MINTLVILILFGLTLKFSNRLPLKVFRFFSSNSIIVIYLALFPDNVFNLCVRDIIAENEEIISSLQNPLYDLMAFGWLLEWDDLMQPILKVRKTKYNAIWIIGYFRDTCALRKTYVG